MKNIQQIFFITLLIAGSLLIHVNSTAQTKTDTLTSTLSSTYPREHNTGSLADFPKIHPLVVHVPIMCLILAFIGQIISLIVFKRELSWVVLTLAIIAFVGAYLASGIFHGGDPNLSMLDPVTRATFQKHDQYAGYTVWLSGIAALAKIISHFFLKRRTGYEIIELLLLAAGSYTVIITGEMGARLVHIDGIGVQGRGIPPHDDM